ncbi:MAG TPA: ROK family protein [Anaerolineales bacterium]|nr:ROK family protein [Anaerolineales bacterium]
MRRLFGGIEAGGTKFLCAVGSGPDDLIAEERIPTTSPPETLGQAIAFFRKQEAELGRIAALGIGSFGPVDLDPQSPHFGWITSTPKPGWADTDLRSPFLRALQIPVAVETDVNAAALGEGRWGAAQGLDTFLYMTIGTGIGGGVLVEGKPLHGLLHPEMGHIRIPHDRTVDPFEGVCPFHGDCLEGLATGPAIERRWHAPAPSLPEDHPAWRLEAHYLALALTNFICTLSPQRVILGGGVMAQASLLPRIRKEVVELLHGYVQAPPILEAIDEYIVPPALGSRSGILGSLALASLLPG